MQHPVLKTLRLVLTPYSMDDVDELHRVMSNPRVMEHIGSGALTRTEVAEIVTRSVAGWNAAGMGWWTIRKQADRQLIGQISLKPARDIPDIETGFALDDAHWRQGYGREALSAVVKHGTEEKAANRIIATVRPENMPSRKLLETCGFAREPDIFLRNKTLCLYAYNGP